MKKRGTMKSISRIAALTIVGASLGVAQTDPLNGTWVMNPTKSTYTPGPGPKSQTVLYLASPEGVKVTATTIDASGKMVKTEYTAKYDGNDYPVTGNADWDAIALKRIDSHTLEFTRKRAGKTVQTGTNVVSTDGKTRTITTTGVNAKGEKIRVVVVYDKK